MRLIVASFFICAWSACAEPAQLCENKLAPLTGQNRPFLGQLDNYQMELLAQHPIAETARKMKGGEGLRFFIYPFEDGRKISFSYINGEHIQAMFLQAILRQLFPSAQFLHGNSKLPRRPHGDIQIDIGDSFEGGDNGPELLEMSDIKAANGRFREISKKEARDQLKLNQNLKIAHVYSFYTVGQRSRPDVRPKLHVVFSKLLKLGFDTVILSFRENPDVVIPMLLKEQPQIKERFSRIVWLTKSEQSSGRGPSFIVNDTRGTMATVHSAADFNLVIGRNNYFEALYTGRPTVYFNLGENDKAVQRMQRVAKGFRNFAQIDRLSALTQVPQEAEAQDYPASAFNALLDNLDRRIRK